MSITINFSGQPYPIPSQAERNWAAAVNTFFQALAANALPKSGGNFTLASDLNLGSTGQVYVKALASNTAGIAAAGFLKLAKTDVIAWRNNAGSADLGLGIDGSDRLTFNGSPIAAAGDLTTLTGRVTTAEGIISQHTTDISANASAVATKLNKTGGIATSLNIDDFLEFDEEADPPTPAAGKVRLWASTDKKYYQKDSTGAKSQLGGGGLIPVEVTALPANLVNGVSYEVSAASATAALLPVTALACTIEVIDVKGTCSPTITLDVTPGGTDTVLWKGTAQAVTVRGRRSYVVMRFMKAAGSSVWTVTFQVVAIPQGGQIPGKINGATTGPSFIGEWARVALGVSPQTATGDVYVDSSTNFTLQPGEYEIDVNVPLRIDYVSASAQPVFETALRKADNSVVEKYTYYSTPAAAGSAESRVVSFRTIVDLAVATIFKVSLVSNAASTNSRGNIQADGNAAGTRASSSYVLWKRIG